MAEICVGDIRGELVKDLADLVERVVNARSYLPRYYILIRAWWEFNTLRTRAAILNPLQGAAMEQRPVLNTILLEIDNKRGVANFHWYLPADIPICEDALSREEVADAAESAIKTRVPLIWK